MQIILQYDAEVFFNGEVHEFRLGVGFFLKARYHLLGGKIGHNDVLKFNFVTNEMKVEYTCSSVFVLSCGGVGSGKIESPPFPLPPRELNRL